MTDSIFCNPNPSDVLFEDDLAYVRWDGFPVTPKHALVIPKRPVPSAFDMTEAEWASVRALVRKTRDHIEAEDSSVSGFNVGFNDGQAGGQTIFHAHIHVIPRRDGDVEIPRGGIRHVIPGKGSY